MQIVRQVVGREPAFHCAYVAWREARVRIDPSGEELHAERAPRHKPDAEFFAERNHVLLRPAPQHRVFVLHGGDRQRRMRAPQRVQAHLGEAPMADLALAHKALHGARNILDGHVGIDAVLIEQVDAVRAQAP